MKTLGIVIGNINQSTMIFASLRKEFPGIEIVAPTRPNLLEACERIAQTYEDVRNGWLTPQILNGEDQELDEDEVLPEERAIQTVVRMLRDYYTLHSVHTLVLIYRDEDIHSDHDLIDELVDEISHEHCYTRCLTMGANRQPYWLSE